MKHSNFAKQYEAQRIANQGVFRGVLPWSEPGSHYRALYNEVRLGLLVDLKRVTRIPLRYRRDAHRELLTLVLRLLNGTPNPSNPDTMLPSGRRRRSPKLVLISSRDQSECSPGTPNVRRVPATVGNVSQLPAESKPAATTRRAANVLAVMPTLARKARTRATRERHG